MPPVNVPLWGVDAENPADLGVAKSARRVGASGCVKVPLLGVSAEDPADLGMAKSARGVGVSGCVNFDPGIATK